MNLELFLPPVAQGAQGPGVLAPILPDLDPEVKIDVGVQQGFDYITLGLVCEELEAMDTSLRVVMSVHMGLNSLALLQWGTEDQKQGGKCVCVVMVRASG